MNIYSFRDKHISIGPPKKDIKKKVMKINSSIQRLSLPVPKYLESLIGLSKVETKQEKLSIKPQLFHLLSFHPIYSLTIVLHSLVTEHNNVHSVPSAF